MLLGCGLVTTGVPLVLKAGMTGAPPGGSNYYPSSNQGQHDPTSLGRVLLSGGATPDSGELSV